MSSFVNSGTPQLFKYLYPNEGWRMLVSSNRPFLAMVPKGEAATGVTTGGSAPQGAGTGILHVWNYSNAQGVSQSHTSALLQQDSLVTGTQVMVQLSQFYKYIRLNAKELAASRNNLAAYVSTKKLNLDSALNQMGLEIDLASHRSGSGVIATISSVSGSVLTLSAGPSIQQFQVGQIIVSASTNPSDGSAPALGSGTATVQKIQIDQTATGYTIKLTVSNASGFDSSTNKYIMQSGNVLGFSATNQEGSLIGMGNWVPTADPASGDSFLSVNRFTDVVRLSGVRMSASGRTYREAIQELAATIGAMGGKPDVCLLNPLDWTRANVELQGFARYEDFKVGDIAFTSMSIASPAGGTLRLMQDPNQDIGTIRINTMDTWKMWHLNDLVHLIMDDGLEMRKDSGADAFQLGVRSWPQLCCFEPGSNGVATF